MLEKILGRGAEAISIRACGFDDLTKRPVKGAAVSSAEIECPVGLRAFGWGASANTCPLSFGFG
jgi:hypothetical protein